jgi:hypothetical protein
MSQQQQSSQGQQPSQNNILNGFSYQKAGINTLAGTAVGPN